MKLALLVGCVILNLPSSSFTLWCAVKGVCFGREICHEKRTRRRGSSGPTVRRQSSVSLTNRNGYIESALGLCHLSAADLTIIFTSLCLISIVIAEFGLLGLQVCVLRDWILNRDHPWGHKMFGIFLSITVFSMIISFTFSFLTLFERLRSCFINTNHKIPDWYSHVVWLMGFILLAVYISFWIFPARSTTPTLLWGVIAVEYIFGCMFLLHGFVSRIFLVAGNVSNLNDAMDDKLINVGVKMTVCVGVSLISSLIDFVSVFCQSFFCADHTCGFYLELFPSVLAEIDLAVNAFCILCTLARSHHYYIFVFGYIHQKCLRFLIKRSKPIAKNLQLEQAQLPSNSVVSNVNGIGSSV